MNGATKATVESVVGSLNDKAEQLGMDRRFEFYPGSGPKGISHQLAEIHPGLSHPTVTKIGKTLSEAHDYVLAMNHALASALLDKQHRRSRQPTGLHLPLKLDPDARSRRPGEPV